MYIMLVILSKKQHKYVVGRGFAADFVNFLNTNKDTIANVAGVVGNVAKAGATTANAARQIYDVVRAGRARNGKGLTQKSLDILKGLTN